MSAAHLAQAGRLNTEAGGESSGLDGRDLFRPAETPLGRSPEERANLVPDHPGANGSPHAAGSDKVSHFDRVQFDKELVGEYHHSVRRSRLLTFLTGSVALCGKDPCERGYLRDL
jgi:hypothetical protein